MMDDDEDDPRKIMLAGRAAELDQLNKQYAATRNPLYVWEAVRHCHHPNHPQPYPEWVRTYLHATAEDLCALGMLRNPNTYPVRQPAESEDQHFARYRQWLAEPDLKPRVALSLTARALGLVRDGWNAFQRFHANAGDRSTALDFDLRHDQTKQQALDKIMLERGLGEERSARRRIARGRKLLGRSPPKRQGTKPPP